MFKRGDIVICNGSFNKDSYAIFDGSRFLWFALHKGEKDYSSFNETHWNKYTGPEYEKDGQRFVPSGEFRKVAKGEVYLQTVFQFGVVIDSVMPHCKGLVRFYPILLLVPELEEAECKLCRGTGVCRDCVPEHEFKVGDWVKSAKSSAFEFRWCAQKKYAVGPNAVGYELTELTKLPGRPLTTDDLMHNASGWEITIHCDACGCKGVVETIWPACYKDGVAFFHKGASDPIAVFKDGSIVFAAGVEGNIFVVSE